MARTRSRIGTVPAPAVVKIYYTRDGVGPYQSVLASGGLVGTDEIMTDESHPGFRQIMKQGGVVLGNMSLSKWSRTVESGHLLIGWHTIWGKAWIDGDVAEILEANTPPLPNANDGVRMGQIALIKAYAKAKQSPVLGGEVLHDLEITLGMLHRPFQGARTLLGKMYKYRAKHLGKTAASATRATANAWLEYRYGWQPLLLDGKTIIKECQARRETWERTHRSVARATESSVNTQTTTFDDAPLLAECKVSGSVSVSTGMRASAGVIFDQTGQTASQNAARVIGARACDFPATIWEVIPYSFVVDWFVNVGDWIQAITPVPGLNIIGSWVTTVENTTVTCNGGTLKCEVTSAPATTYYGSVGSSHKTVTNITRSINQPITLTPVVIARPLSLLHQVDGLSLACNRILGQLRGFR